MNSYIDTEFTQADINDKLKQGEYENCVFKNIVFANLDLSAYKFIDCHFKSCDISHVRMDRTVLNRCEFEGCKIMGTRFDRCENLLLEFRFKDCILDHSTFFQLKIKQTSFIDCSLKGVDFSACDLSSAKFENCNLEHATFDQTNLERADFSTAYNYNLDPAQNKIKKAVFSSDGLIGLLNKYDIKLKS